MTPTLFLFANFTVDNTPDPRVMVTVARTVFCRNLKTTLAKYIDSSLECIVPVRSNRKTCHFCLHIDSILAAVLTLKSGFYLAFHADCLSFANVVFKSLMQVSLLLVRAGICLSYTTVVLS